MNTLGAAAGIGLGLIFTSTIESALPVTAMMRAIGPTYDQGAYTARIEGVKIKDCVVVADSFVGWQKIGGAWRETGFSFVDDATPEDSKPKSTAKQDFGIWQWHNINPEAEAVRLSLIHNCRGDLTVTTVNIDVDLGEGV